MVGSTQVIVCPPQLVKFKSCRFFFPFFFIFVYKISRFSSNLGTFVIWNFHSLIILDAVDDARQSCAFLFLMHVRVHLQHKPLHLLNLQANA